jgi:hypothetical protein
VVTGIRDKSHPEPRTIDGPGKGSTIGAHIIRRAVAVFDDNNLNNKAVGLPILILLVVSSNGLDYRHYRHTLRLTYLEIMPRCHRGLLRILLR